MFTNTVTVVLRLVTFVHGSSDSAVKVKVSAPLRLAPGVYVKRPSACTVTLPLAGCVTFATSTRRPVKAAGLAKLASRPGGVLTASGASSLVE
jgi:hypothetical protein